MKTVSEYLAIVPKDQLVILQKIRLTIKQIAPEAEESISYGLPAYKYKGKPLIYYGSFKNHMSLFATSQPTAAFAEKLKDYKVSKGTIQFTIEKPLPEGLLEEIITYRMEQIERA